MNNNKSKLSLVNTHTHAAMVAFRGRAEDLPLKIWLEKHIWPSEAKEVNAHFVYKNTKRAISEMRKNSIEAFCDMYFFEEEVARAAEELKMSVMIGECVLDFPTPSAKSPDESLKITEELIKKYKKNPYVKVTVAPHSIYAASRETLLKCKNLAEKYKAPLHIHLAETKFEFDECKKKNKCTPVEYLEKLGMLNEKSILAHCVWVTDEDIKTLAKRKANVSHCPLSNLKLGSGIAPVARMVEAGINVSLGTDGAASSNRLDIFEAGKFAALLQKGTICDPTQLPARTAVEMMTVNGMQTLGLGKIKNQTSIQIKKELEKIKDFSFLYS